MGWKKVTKEELKNKYDNRGKYDNGTRKGYIDSAVAMFVPTEGENKVRILPLHQNEKDTRHYGIDVFFHRNVGVSENYYLCLKRMKKGNCPICEHQKTLWNDEPELAKTLYPDQRTLMWVIDREDEKVKLWSAPKSLMDDIIGVCYKKKTGEVIDISDPNEGFDLYFDRIGKGMTTKYKNLQLDDESNFVDETLSEFIKPFTEALIWSTYEEIYKDFTGEQLTIETVETEKVRNLNEEIEATTKETEIETIDIKMPNVDCFTFFDGNSETCDDCDKRKECRTETKKSKTIEKPIINETATNIVDVNSNKLSTKERLDALLKNRKKNG